MANIISVRGFTPTIAPGTFIAQTATIIGDVTIGEGSSVWYGAVLRGDVSPIVIGKNTNIQDGAVLHGTFQKSITVIGDGVTVGHNATIHGATIHNDVLVGMGSVILDNAEIESNTIIAAGALVKANTKCEGNSLYAGVPAKKVKELDETHPTVIEKYAQNYQMYTEWYKDDDLK